MPNMFTQMDAVCHRFEELSIRLNQPVHRILKSMPTRSTSKLDAPQGCFLRVRMVSPTAMSIALLLPSACPKQQAVYAQSPACRFAAHTDIV